MKNRIAVVYSQIEPPDEELLFFNPDIDLFLFNNLPGSLRTIMEIRQRKGWDQDIYQERSKQPGQIIQRRSLPSYTDGKDIFIDHERQKF